MAQVGAPNTTSEAPDPQKQRGEDPSAAYASPSLSPPSQDLPATGFQSILHPYPVPTRADHLTRSADDGDDRGARDRSQAPRVGSGSASRGEPPADLLNKTQGAFIPKLYAMCSSDWLDEMIAWTDGGATFTVFCPSEFSRTVLPQFFKHSNYNSFVRQLNIYGFHKVHQAGPTPIKGNSADAAWEFKHEAFQRDQPDLLVHVKRKSKPGAAGALALAVGAAAAAAAATGLPSPDPSSQRSSKKRSASESGSSTTSRADREVEPLNTSVAGSAGGRAPARSPSVPSSTVDHQRPASSPHVRSTSPFRRTSFEFPSRDGDNDVARHVAELDAQVRTLSESLQARQLDAVHERENNLSVLQMLLNAVATLDVPDHQREQLDAAQRALFSSSSRHPPSHSNPLRNSHSESPRLRSAATHSSSSSWDDRSSQSYAYPPPSLSHQHRYAPSRVVVPSIESWTRGDQYDPLAGLGVAGHHRPALSQSGSSVSWDRNRSPAEVRTSLPSLADLLRDDAEGGLAKRAKHGK